MLASNKKTLKNAAMADILFVQAILRGWDPIGVEPGVAAPADEYDSYAPHIVSMIRAGCTTEALASHLEHLSSETMGLGPSNSLSLSNSRSFAAEIVASVRRSNISLEADA